VAREHVTESEVAPEAAAPVAAPAAAPEVARVLELQRSAGNRAVTAMLARQAAPAAAAPAASTVASTTDPRLGYRAAGVADTPGLDRQRLPFNDPDHPMNGWDWRTILDRLTQHDEQSFTFSDEVRCGANAALAIAIMYGPRQVLSFAAHVERIAHNRQGALAHPGGAPGSAQAAAFSRALDNVGAEVGAHFAASAIAQGYATYGDLSDIAHAAKVALTANSSGFSTGAEVVGMATAAGTVTRTPRFLPIASRAAFADKMAELESGEVYIVHVDTDVLAEGAATNINQGNHFVVVGQEPGDFGAHFLYDPYPRTGRQWTTSFNDDFWTLFETAGGTWKWVMIECKVKPPRGTVLS
jgi:hypothetical protein